MSSNTKMNANKFDRMTKEEKLRFCQDLIRQAAHLSKSSTGNKINAPISHSKSKQTTSMVSENSKKTKTDKSIRSGRNRTNLKVSKSSQLPSSLESSSHDHQSKSKHSSPSKTISHRSFKQTNIDRVRSASNTSDNRMRMKNIVSKKVFKRGSTRSPTGTRKRSSRKSKSKARKKSRVPVHSSRARSTATSKSAKKKNVGTKRVKSSIKEKIRTSGTRSVSRSTPTNGKQHGTSIKHKGKSSTRKTRTEETCLVRFVPKFNPKSHENQVPIYHLIRRAFGNMVREAICQLDTNKSGVSSEKILEHILQHYHFPNNLSENVIRHRTMFTINSGIRAGTLKTVNPNKALQIGRIHRIYPRIVR